MRWSDSLRIYFADFWGTLAGKTWAIRFFSDLGMDGSKCLKLCRNSLHIHHWVLQSTMPSLPHMYGTWGRGWGGRETTWSMEPFLLLVGGQGRHTAKEKLSWWGKKEPVMAIAEFSNWHTSFILTVCKLWSSMPDHQQRLGIYYFRPWELEE